METTLAMVRTKHGGWGRNRHALRRCLLSIIVIPGLLLFSNVGTAGQINIPWTVDLFIPAGNDPAVVDVPPFESTYTGIEVAIPNPLIDTVGFDFTSTHEHSYAIHLPFEINISAPDKVSPGQFVTLESSAVLAGPASFSTVGTVDFDTSLFTTAGPIKISESFGSYGLKGELDVFGFTGTAADSVSYSDTDTSAEEKLTRTIWKNDPYGNPLQLNRAERFEGYELQTTGNMDAWEAGVNLLETVGHFFPPVGLASVFTDINASYGLDIVEDTYLTTQFVTGYYTDDGQTYDDFLINGADRKGWLTIPDTLSPGDSYNIQMTALGLGFTSLFEYSLQGNIDVDLETIFGDEDITEIPFSTFLVDSWADRFQHVEYLSNFLDLDDFLDASLSFEIIGGLEDQDPALTAPPWEAAKVDPLIGDLIDAEADPNQQGYEFPGNPPMATVVVSSVPEPSTLMLFAVSLLGFATLGSRKKSTM